MIKLLLFFLTFIISLQVVATGNSTAENFSSASKSKRLVVGYIDFQPLYGTVNNKPHGLLIDITRKVFDELSLSYKERAMPTKRLFTSLKRGRVQIWCGIKIKELQDKVWSGSKALHHLSLNLYSLSEPMNKVKKSDLKGKKVILLLGYNYGGWGDYIRNKKNGVNFIDVKRHDDALRLLKKGRYQYLLNYRAPMNIALKKLPIPELKQSNINELPIVFNVTKSMKDGKQLLTRLESKLVELIKSGQVVIQ